MAKGKTKAKAKPKRVVKKAAKPSPITEDAISCLRGVIQYEIGKSLYGIHEAVSVVGTESQAVVKGAIEGMTTITSAVQSELRDKLGDLREGQILRGRSLEDVLRLLAELRDEVKQLRELVCVEQAESEGAKLCGVSSMDKHSRAQAQAWRDMACTVTNAKAAGLIVEERADGNVVIRTP